MQTPWIAFHRRCAGERSGDDRIATAGAEAASRAGQFRGMIAGGLGGDDREISLADELQDGHCPGSNARQVRMIGKRCGVRKSLRAVLSFLVVAGGVAGWGEGARPRITGISHICVYSTDMGKMGPLLRDGAGGAEGGGPGEPGRGTVLLQRPAVCRGAAGAGRDGDEPAGPPGVPDGRCGGAARVPGGARGEGADRGAVGRRRREVVLGDGPGGEPGAVRADPGGGGEGGRQRDQRAGDPRGVLVHDRAAEDRFTKTCWGSAPIGSARSSPAGWTGSRSRCRTGATGWST